MTPQDYDDIKKTLLHPSDVRQWPRVLPQMQFYMDRRVNRAIGCSPFEGQCLGGGRPQILTGNWE